MNPIYQEKVVYNNVSLDGKQQATLPMLAELWQQYNNKKTPWYHRKQAGINVAQGFYLYGPPGTGKSTLIRLVYDSIAIPTTQKGYFHTTRFINDLNTKLNQTEHADPLEKIIKQLSKYQVIFLDEFQILDVASSYIMRHVILELFHKGVLLYFTSNYAPDELYQNGLQRHKFLELVHHINRHCIVHKLDNGVDYRCLTNKASSNLIRSDSLAANKTALLDILSDLCSTDYSNISKGQVISKGRVIDIEFSHHRIACMEFLALCGNNLAAYDYHAIAKQYDQVLIYGIKEECFDDLNLCHRFVAMLDEFYEAKTVLTAGFLFDWRHLISIGKQKQHKIPAMQRAISRLQEMLKW
jgi:cell division protein ZapE